MPFLQSDTAGAGEVPGKIRREGTESRGRLSSQAAAGGAGFADSQSGGGHRISRSDCGGFELVAVEENLSWQSRGDEHFGSGGQGGNYSLRESRAGLFSVACEGKCTAGSGFRAVE